jgi:hypothetical protein
MESFRQTPQIEKTPESPENIEQKRKERVQQIVELVKEINEQKETRTFPGITPEIYSSMKKDEEYFSGYTTPIDELLEKFTQEGMKIVLGKNPDSGNVFVLPSNSDDITMDSVAPHQLIVTPGMDEKLMELINLTGRK